MGRGGKRGGGGGGGGGVGGRGGGGGGGGRGSGRGAETKEHFSRNSKQVLSSSIRSPRRVNTVRLTSHL